NFVAKLGIFQKRSGDGLEQRRHAVTSLTFRRTNTVDLCDGGDCGIVGTGNGGREHRASRRFRKPYAQLLDELIERRARDADSEAGASAELADAQVNGLRESLGNRIAALA